MLLHPPPGGRCYQWRSLTCVKGSISGASPLHRVGCNRTPGPAPNSCPTSIQASNLRNSQLLRQAHLLGHSIWHTSSLFDPLGHSIWHTSPFHFFLLAPLLFSPLLLFPLLLAPLLLVPLLLSLLLTLFTSFPLPCSVCHEFVEPSYPVLDHLSSSSSCVFLIFQVL